MIRLTIKPVQSVHSSRAPRQPRGSNLEVNHLEGIWSIERQMAAALAMRRMLVVPWGEEGQTEPENLLRTAGQRVRAGRYRRIDVAFGEVVDMSEGDHLPASLDGHVAAYERIPDARVAVPAGGWGR